MRVMEIYAYSLNKEGIWDSVTYKKPNDVYKNVTDLIHRFQHTDIQYSLYNSIYQKPLIHMCPDELMSSFQTTHMDNFMCPPPKNRKEGRQENVRNKITQHFMIQQDSRYNFFILNIARKNNTQHCYYSCQLLFKHLCLVITTLFVIISFQKRTLAAATTVKH